MFRDAKIQFTKYAAPLLYLSGLDITVVEVSACHVLVADRPVAASRPRHVPDRVSTRAIYGC
jgi:hypothetical protein